MHVVVLLISTKCPYHYFAFLGLFVLFILQINDLNQVPVPVMLLPDDFKANTKIKVQNHLFNK